MKVKFLHPVQGLAYFEGDTPDLTPEQVEKYNLVKGGHAILVPETEGGENELPDDMPMRDLLFKEGLQTVADVRNALPTITDINGIGDSKAKQIKEFIETIND